MTDSDISYCSLNINCYIPWKNNTGIVSVIPSNSRPIPQARKWHAPARPMPSCNNGVCNDNNISIGVSEIDHNDYVSGAGFIARRTIKNASKNAQGVWYRAAPNPIKHWRKQLHPRQSDLPGAYWNTPSERASIRHLMETPGSYVNINSKYKSDNSILCNGAPSIPKTSSITTYINYINLQGSCLELANIEGSNNNCQQKITRRSSMFSKDYHSSSKSYLQSRSKLYRQKEAIQFNHRKNIIPSVSKPNMFESLYKTDISGCFTPIDCSCVIQVVYKPRNMVFAQDNSVASSLYVNYIKEKTITQNQYNITNKWGIDNVNSFKKYPCNPYNRYTGNLQPAGGSVNRINCSIK